MTGAIGIRKICYFVDPETDSPHIYNHGVDENEMEDVLNRPGEDRQGPEGARVAIGQTRRALSPNNLCTRIPGTWRAKAHQRQVSAFHWLSIHQDLMRYNFAIVALA